MRRPHATVARTVCAPRPVDRCGCPAKRHGTRSTYTKYGCRCPDAREDYRLTRKRLREHRWRSPLVDSTGTARRVQGLIAAGFEPAYLSAELGGMNISRLANQYQPTVRVETATAVRALAMRLADKVGTSAKARQLAERHGWVNLYRWDDIDDPAAAPDPPEDLDAPPTAAWTVERGAGVDEHALDLACSGAVTPPLNRATRVEAVRRLASWGLSDTVIAERLWWYRDSRRGANSVGRFRLRHGIPAARTPHNRRDVTSVAA